MATIDEHFRSEMLQKPNDDFRAIVRTDIDATYIARQWASHEAIVHRQFRLIPGFALTAKGKILLALANDPHVTHIEPDREISL